MSSKFLTRTAILCTAILSASCGSSGGGTTPPDNTPSTISKTGSALADGYLAFATVCLDTTGDKSCADEDASLKDTTDVNGSFTLSALAEQYAAFALVLEAEAGTAKEGGNDIPSKIVLSAPIGETDVVSPLTTLAESYLQANASLSSADAEDKLLEDLEITDSTVSIYDDYIALLAAVSTGKSIASGAVVVGVVKDDYTLLKQVAQVASLSLQKNLKAVQDAVGAGTSQLNLASTRRSLIAVIGNDIFNQIADIARQARAAGINFTPANVVRLLNVADIETGIVEQDATANATAVSVQDNLTDGVSFFGFEDAVTGKTSSPFMEQQSFSLVPAAVAGVKKKKKSTSRYNTELGQFDAILNNNGSVPANGTWQKLSAIDITFNTDGSAIVNTLGRSLKQQAITTDVSGLKLKTFVSPGMKAYVKPNDTFSTGAKAIRPTFRFLTDFYIINPNNTANINTFPRSGTNGAIITAADNAVVLDDLLTPTASKFNFATQVPLNDDTDPTNDISPKAAFFDNINPRIKFTVEFIGIAGDTTGIAEFYEYNFADRTQSNYHRITHIATGTWQRKNISLGNDTGGTAQTADIITTEVPAIIRQQVYSKEFEKIKRVRVFTAFNGLVRRGRFVPQGVITTKQNWRFNSIATANIVANVNATVGSLNGFFPTLNSASLTQGAAFNVKLRADSTEATPQGIAFGLLNDFGSQPFIRGNDFVVNNISGNDFVLTTSAIRSVRDINTFNADGTGSIFFGDDGTTGIISQWAVNTAGQLTYTETSGTDTYSYVATPIIPTRFGDNALIEINSSIIQGKAGFESILLPVHIEKSTAVPVP